MNLKKIIFLFLVFLFNFFAGGNPSDNLDYKRISNVKLVSPYKSILKSTTKIPFGLWVVLNEGWHSYWRYPGESGKALTARWSVSTTSSVSQLKWPLPERKIFGSFINFVYEHSFLLMGELSVPKGHGNKNINFTAQVDWLICKEVCIPMSRQVEINWPVKASLTTDYEEKQTEETDSYWKPLFDERASRIPEEIDKEVKLQNKGKHWLVQFSTDKELQLKEVFPLSKNFFSLEPPEILSTRSYQHSFLMSSVRSGSNNKSKFPGASVVNKKSLKKKVRALTVFEDQNKTKGVIYTFTSKKESVLWFLLLAFIGGMILNFMPCVLPIVFLKFSNTLEQSRQKTQVVILGNLFYSAGVIFSFISLALLLLLFKKSGESVGWGFQMQSPYFLVSIIFLFVLVSFGFMGWFSFSLPSVPFFHRGQNNFKHFLTGVLSTTSASPCTVPFMGAALGYAFSGSGFQLIMVFLFLGIGLSFPYLLLSVFPSWIRYVPLPGAWSVKLKHFMAFPMLATSIWLIHLFNRQKPEHLLQLLFSLLLLAFGFWLLSNFKKSTYLKWLFYAVIFGALIYPFASIRQGVSGYGSNISWGKFSLEKMESLHSEGQAVFVNFTADWCLTCKLNEQLTFKNKAVIRFFEERQIHALKGDWTNKNPEITAVLDRYQRTGIPFYLYFPPGKPSSSAVILPELLTPGLFFKYVNKK